MKVPKIINQLWIGDKPAPRNAMNSVMRMNPEYTYVFWDEKTIADRLKIKKKYQIKIDCMEELNGKADMYRYLILEQYGGVFIDADIISLEPLDDFLLNEPFFCWENEIARPNLCATTVMGFPPNHKIVKGCIDYIMNNRITSPAWRSVGPELLTKMVNYYGDNPEVKIFPSYYFLPDHHTGLKYTGHGKVYASHEWGSTFNSYEKLNNLTIAPHHKPPKDSIDIFIPKCSDKKLKEIMRGIKDMNGHFNINIKYDKDLSKYLKSMRNVRQYELPLELLNEHGNPVNLNMEFIEQALVKRYIKDTDKVLELGARYGSVSITANKKLKDKKNHYVVEPDKRVWECLENNMKMNKADFNIIKGIIGNEKCEVVGDGYATHTIKTEDSETECFPLPNVDFNVLIADCEGYLETFYDQFPELFDKLELIMFETDRPEACDYDKIIKGLLDRGFKQLEKIPEPNMPNMFHYIFFKSDMEIHDTRNDMIVKFAKNINKPKICELGVFKGEFLDFIEQNIDYGAIDGVDLFQGTLSSGDVDGNNVSYCDLENQLIYLNNKYKNNKNVNLYKAYTNNFLSEQKDDIYDIIYIDADHSYEGVKRDIELSYKKVKNGGYIMGHDYEMNMDKAEEYYHFGTRQAVDEFCVEHNQKIIAKGIDGCVSFCIQVKK